MMRIGLIGVGKMGLPIACNLMERGFEVTGFRRGPADDLIAAGGRVAASPAELAADADVLMSILPDSAAVDEVIRGISGTLRQMRPGTVHLEMSTIEVAVKSKLRDAVVDAGGDLLDCPISGSPGMVAPRLATTFVSGDQDSVDRVRSVLDAISGRWVHTGDFGTATRLKYVANLLVAVHTVAAAEAMAVAESCGLDLALVQSTLDDGIASSTIWKQRGPVMRRREWEPAPGPIDTLAQILDQIEVAAATAGVATPVFAAAKTLFDQARELDRGQLDIASVLDQVAPPRPGVAT
jgi:3-hydroxyisobutyrate dehydrogenase